MSRFNAEQLDAAQLGSAGSSTHTTTTSQRTSRTSGAHPGSSRLGGAHPGTAREIVALFSDATLEQIPELCKRYREDPRLQVKHALASVRRRYDKEQAERARVRAMYERMEAFAPTASSDSSASSAIIVGIDEVGRGALAGPLTVCAVALPADPIIWGLNDSKRLTPHKRELLAAQISARALAIGTAHVEPQRIDEIGMGAAVRFAMAQALKDTQLEPDVVLIDGNPVHIHPKEHCIVKGDAQVACIAAASIVAKVTRDALMVEYDAKYPQYHFAHSKGYGSAEHIAAIKAYGLTPLHRVSFCGNFLETPSLF